MIAVAKAFQIFLYDFFVTHDILMLFLYNLLVFKAKKSVTIKGIASPREIISPQVCFFLADANLKNAICKRFRN